MDDGYAIIDWKWRHFHPLFGTTRQATSYDAQSVDYHSNCDTYYNTNESISNGAIANEEYYLLSIHWNEITNLNAIWRMEDGRKIEKPEIRSIKCSEIEKYGDYTTTISNIRKKYKIDIFDGVMAEYYLYSQNMETYINFVNEMELLQSMYVETLNQMINNKYFDK